ncbi:MAG: peptidase S24 [Acidobacteria bacterium]|nr:MAG: peptidase S24 [Acidobacteriota bacterium]
MRLYSGTTKSLIEDSTFNRIAPKLKDAFFNEFRYQPSVAEVNSWNNSLRAISQVFQTASLLDHGVLLELRLPLTSKRLDCLVTGYDSKKAPNAVIIELKQWSGCRGASGKNEVATFVGGNVRDVLHPSVQVGQYMTYLTDCHTAFQGAGGISAHACSYLHNYTPIEDDPLFLPQFAEQIRRSPVFTADHVPRLTAFLDERIHGADSGEVSAKVEQSKYRPSKKLLDHVAKLIKGKPEYVLLDEQLVVYDKVVEAAKDGAKGRKRVAIIVRGGPGTGKSVIAMNLLGDLSGMGLNAHYVTGSRAFTSTIREIVGTRGAAQVRYFNSYMGADANVIDVMIADEAHRIRETSNNRFTPKVKQSKLSQIQELLKASRTSVFFIDDNQIVRPGEIGSTDYIKAEAEKLHCDVCEFELEAQFRCAGSDAFVSWVNNTLGIQRTPHVMWNQAHEFDFRIMPTPQALEDAIRKRLEEKFTARLAAGFCWPWSKPRSNGTLVDDVVIDDYVRPWNAKSDSGSLASGIPKESLWAYDAGGVNQIGCVYTAQGFEFDYVGVIFGPDLVYVPEAADWKGEKTKSFDTVVKRSGDRFTQMVKNTYRVLLTRGMKGCYVHFMDKNTENLFRSRVEHAAKVQ